MKCQIKRELVFQNNGIVVIISTRFDIMNIDTSDEHWLESIWEQYCCRLLGFIRSRVGDDAESEDILQDVFFRIHKNLCCQPMPERFESWIFQVTRNLIIDHYRRQRVLVEIPENIKAEEEFREGDLEAELAGSLKDLVTSLPPIYREAILLTEFQGMDQKELAKQLGISLSGAKSRVQRGREKLRDMLLCCCHFEFDRRGGIIDYYEHCCGCHTGCNPE